MRESRRDGRPWDRVSPARDWGALPGWLRTSLRPFRPPQGPARCGLEPVGLPVQSPRPFLRPPPLPPLAATGTKRSSRIAVLVRPPLPTARGGSCGASSILAGSDPAAPPEASIPLPQGSLPA